MLGVIVMCRSRASPLHDYGHQLLVGIHLGIDDNPLPHSKILPHCLFITITEGRRGVGQPARVNTFETLRSIIY